MILINSDFKTVQISSYMIAKDDIHTRVYRFLLPKVMTSATKTFPTRQLLLAKLESLYGAYFKTRSQLIGDLFMNQITLVFPHPNIVLDQALLHEACQMIDEIARHPFLSSEAFQVEKRLLSEQWKTLKEHKRSYAGVRFSELFYAEDDYAIPVSGTMADAMDATYDGLLNAHQAFAKCSQRIMIANGTFDDSEAGILKSFFGDDDPLSFEPLLVFREARKTPVTTIERDVMKQAILKIGYILPVFRTDRLHNAAIVFDTMFGGYPDSMLFTEIRERLGLCYDIQSSYDAYKGTLVVSAGVDPLRKDIALSAIASLHESLNDNGPTLDQVIQARQFVIHQLKSSLESQSTLSARAFVQTLFKTPEAISERIEKVQKVTRGDVMDVISMIQLDTTFILEGGAVLENDPR
ncbi:MAG: insulinase family protein [Acholeplasmataceae bacterium]|nr:insulinase family protein [Acholeplasmataceae bacterium]